MRRELQRRSLIRIPCCVSFGKLPSFAGRSLSPVPSGVTTEPTSAANTSISLDFEDNTLSVAGGNGVALVALGVLSVLTFLPSCVK